MGNKLLVLLSLVIICIIFGIYALENLNGKINDEDNNFDNENSVSKTEKNIESIHYTSSIYLSSMTSKPPFQVGNKYTYQVWRKSLPSSVLTTTDTTVIPQPSEYIVRVYFDRIERINKDSYFNVEVNGENATKKYLLCGKGRCENLTYSVDLNGELFYINTINGSISYPLSDQSMCMECQFFYSPWMLYLIDNIRWEETMQSNYKGMDLKLVLEYTVEGIEEINGKDCFKVVMNGKNPVVRSSVDKDTKKEDVNLYHIVLKYFFWVDIKERVLVKLEMYEDNILTKKMDLIE